MPGQPAPALTSAREYLRVQWPLLPRGTMRGRRPRAWSGMGRRSEYGFRGREVSPWLNALSVNLQISGIACQNAQNRLVAGCFGRRVRAERLPSTEKRSVFPATGSGIILTADGAARPGVCLARHGSGCGR
jgi:hypothetical protein